MAKKSCPVGDDWIEMVWDGEKLVPAKKLDKGVPKVGYPKGESLNKDGGVEAWDYEPPTSGYITKNTVTSKYYNPKASRRVRKEETRLGRQAVKDGAITNKELRAIQREVKRDSKRMGWDPHEEASMLRTLISYQARKNGFTGNAGKGKSWVESKIDGNFNEGKQSYINRTINLQSESIKGKYKLKDKTARVIVSDINNPKKGKDIVKKFKGDIPKKASTPKVLEAINMSLENTSVKIPPGNIKRFSEDLYLNIAEAASYGTDKFSLQKIIGKTIVKHSEGTVVNKNIPLGMRAKELIDTADKLIKNLDDLLPFNVKTIWSKNNDPKNLKADGTVAKMQSNEIIDPKPSWEPLTEGMDNVRLLSNSARTPGKNKTVATGASKDMNGRELISGKDDVVFNKKITSGQAREIGIANKRTTRIDDDMLFVLKDLGETNPARLGDGTYFNSAKGATNDAYKMTVATANRTKKYKEGMQFQHFEGTNGRIYTRGGMVNPNGNPWQKQLNKTGKAGYVKKGESDDTLKIFKRQASEHLPEVDDLTNKNFDHRLRIFDSYADDLNSLGKDILNRTKGVTAKHSDFLSKFKDDDLAYVISSATEWARMTKHIKNKGSLNGYPTSNIIGQDITASGPQNMSMLFGSWADAKKTNISPTIDDFGAHIKASPYLEPAKKLKDLPVVQNNPFLAKTFADDKVVEGILKKPTMITLYNAGDGLRITADGSVVLRNTGGGKSGIADKVDELLEDVRKEFPEFAKLKDNELIELTQGVVKGIDEAFPLFKSVTGFLDEIGVAVGKTGKPLEFRMPLTGRKVKWGIKERDGWVNKTFGDGNYKIDPAQQGFKFPATFFHAIDADIVHFVRADLKRQGIDVGTNHDAFYGNIVDYKAINLSVKNALIKLKDSGFMKDFVEQLRKSGQLTKQEADEFLIKLRDISPEDFPDGWKQGLLDAIAPSS